MAFSGDGACNQGTTFEAMNMAVVLKLPVIFVFENNHYSEHTGVSYAVGAKDIASRAEGFGMLARKGDGCDFLATHALMAEIVEYCRSGKGPAAVELDTERFYGHFEGDPQRYRGPGEIARIRETRDCLKIFREQVTAKRWLKAQRRSTGSMPRWTRLIEEAVTEARAAPPPRGRGRVGRCLRQLLTGRPRQWP